MRHRPKHTNRQKMFLFHQTTIMSVIYIQHFKKTRPQILYQIYTKWRFILNCLSSNILNHDHSKFQYGGFYTER